MHLASAKLLRSNFLGCTRKNERGRSSGRYGSSETLSVDMSSI